MAKLLAVIFKPKQVQKQLPLLVKRSFKKNIVTVNLVNGTAKSNAGNGKIIALHSLPPKF